jgi:hydrogenase nickel incorporation protein HypA/HybF
MHEFSLIDSLLRQVNAAAERHGARAITRVTLRVGPLSGAVPDSLQFAFEALREGTLAAGATLVVETTPVVCHCPRCARDFTAAVAQYVCPTCGDAQVEIRGGRELDIAGMEIET